MQQRLSQSIEDYLEAIVVLSTTNKVVRVKDISKKLRVAKSSVHSALHILKNNGLIEHENYGYVELTEKGIEVGNEIYYAHNSITEFLIDVLGLDKEKAKKEACKIEHSMDKATILKLSKFVSFVKNNPNSTIKNIFQRKKKQEK